MGNSVRDFFPESGEIYILKRSEGKVIISKAG